MRQRAPARATERELVVVLVLGSEKAVAHRLGLAHSTVKRHLANTTKVGATTTAQLVWILGPAFVGAVTGRQPLAEPGRGPEGGD